MIRNKELFKKMENREVAESTLWVLENLISGEDIFRGSRWWKAYGNLEEYEYSMPGPYPVDRFKGSGWYQDDYSMLFVKLVPTSTDFNSIFPDVRLKVLPLGLDSFYTTAGDWAEHYNKVKAEIVRNNVFKL